MLKLLSVVTLLVGLVASISDELAAELGYPAGVDVWQVKSRVSSKYGLTIPGVGKLIELRK